MQGTQIQALVQEDSTRWRATKPMCHNYWPHEPQLLKPAHLEPVLHNERSQRHEAHTQQLESRPRSLQLEKCAAMKT